MSALLLFLLGDALLLGLLGSFSAAILRLGSCRPLLLREGVSVEPGRLRLSWLGSLRLRAKTGATLLELGLSPFGRLEVTVSGRGLSSRLYVGGEEPFRRDLVLASELALHSLEGFHLAGPVAELLARLDRGARAVLAKWGPAQAQILSGKIRLVPKRRFLSAAKIHEVVMDALALARSFDGGERSVRDGLLENALRDPDPAVRTRNLQDLLDHFAGSAEARIASRAAARDEDPALRLVGSADLGEEGRESLSRDLLLEEVPEAVRIQALRVAARKLGGASFASIAARVLRHDVPRALRQAAARELAGLIDPDPISTFCELLSSDAPKLGTGAATAIAIELGMMADTRSEPLLLEIAAGFDGEARLAAVRALASAGTARAVKLLLELRAGPAAEEQDLGEELERTLDGIRERLGGRASGRLALGEGGGLALSEAGDGGLSEPGADH